LRMGDLVDALLRLLSTALSKPDKAIADQATRIGRELDALHEAVKAYLAKLDRAELTERDTIRLSDLIEFAVNVGQAGDILERRLAQITRQSAIANELDRDAALALLARVRDDLKLAVSTMMTEDERSARELIEAKRMVNDAERSSSRDHLARLGGADPAALEASSPFLSALRDFKQVNSHLASIGYAVMKPEEHVLTTDPADSEVRHKINEES
jgi:phosphate:Na+ symporter